MVRHRRRYFSVIKLARNSSRCAKLDVLATLMSFEWTALLRRWLVPVFLSGVGSTVVGVNGASLVNRQIMSL